MKSTQLRTKIKLQEGNTRPAYKSSLLLLHRFSSLPFFVMWHKNLQKGGQSFLSCIKKSASPKQWFFYDRPCQSPVGPGVNSTSLASGCARVPRSLTGKFLSDSVIDSVLRLRHLGIRAGLNEVWLPTAAQEFKHTWDAREG